MKNTIVELVRQLNTGHDDIMIVYRTIDLKHITADQHRAIYGKMKAALSKAIHNDLDSSSPTDIDFLREYINRDMQHAAEILNEFEINNDYAIPVEQKK